MMRTTAFRGISRSNRAEPGNYVAWKEVLYLFLLAPHFQHHITPDATEEIKLDGYRAIAVKFKARVALYSRRGKFFDRQYPYIAEGREDLPENTVVDGEIVALDDSGRPAKGSNLCACH